MKRLHRLPHLLLAGALILGLLASCGPEMFEIPMEPTPIPHPTVAPATVRPGAAGSWLVMLYQDADDEILEHDIFIDLNEAEMVGSTPNVTIVAQLDRYSGAYSGDGNWTTTRRYLVTRDNNMERIGSTVLEEMGELDMGKKQTLIDFATWAIQTYPAQKYVLILSDHGAGWLGGWSDDRPNRGSSLRMQDIDEALAQIIANTGIGQFELVGFDACLMGQLEVVSAIAPHARYAVLSEETEPALGWAYAGFLGALAGNPAMSGRDLGQAIVESYITQDARITDPTARQSFLEAMGADPRLSARDVTTKLSADITLSAIDLSVMSDLNAALNGLAESLVGANQRGVAAARSYAQSYTSVFGRDVPPSYIDLGHFVSLLEERVQDRDVKAAARQVRAVLQRAVFAERHGPKKPGSSGLTLYFPNSQVYAATAGRSAQARYTVYAGRFATASLWDDYLAYYYANKQLDPTAADLTVLDPIKSDQTNFQAAAEGSAPAPGAEITAPGAGEIRIAPLEISASEIGPDGFITLYTVVTGTNVGYIYYYVSWYSEEDNSYLTADQGFIAAEDTRELDGVYYPDWGEESVIPIEIDWEPTLYFISDGNEANDQFAFFAPEVYGVTEEDDIYAVRGRYTFADGGKQLDAVIYFSGDGQMQSIYGFIGEGGTGAPREITPKVGDTFTIYEEWLVFDENPDGEFVDYEGGTITFGRNKRLEMVPYYAYSGQYVLGIIVEDMNGNSVSEFVEIVVTE